jgi:tRNA modification GTPase
MYLDDTIAAIASAPGGAARGIVRLSGPRVSSCLEQCYLPERPVNWRDLRRATVIAGAVKLAGCSVSLPANLYYWPTARSYTRQPAAEIHTIGSPPLLAAVLRTVCGAGARLARPGEFTLRAFLAGRLDLVQAEAVLGVIDAQDRAQLDRALSQLAGGISGPLHGLRNALLDLLAHLEAGLDFVEEDIEFISAAELRKQLDAAAAAIAGLCEQLSSRDTASEAMRIVLLGWPNVGKSSLFNALAGQDSALVSDEPGTTRDYLAVRLNLDGAAALLIDTAGVESGLAPITVQAQQLGGQQHREADVQLLCLDSTRRLNAWERELLAIRPAAARIVVLTKIDLPAATDYQGPAVPTSTVSGDGMPELLGELRRIAHAAPAVTPAASTFRLCESTAERCRESLRRAARSLDLARALASSAGQEELVAAEIRIALDELGQIVGAVYTDDVLDRIFSRFCIGK